MSYHFGIVGGSLAGLAAANVLQRLGHSVQVFEKAAANLATSGSSLGYVDNALWEAVRGAPMMRRGRRAHRSQGAYYYGDLWRFLFEGLPPDTVKFGVTVADLGPSPESQPMIQGRAFDAVGIGIGVPEDEVVRPSEGANRQDTTPLQAVPDWFLPFTQRVFRRHRSLSRWLELARSHGKITPQPLYEFRAGRVTRGRLVLIGDAAHMASPRTAAGAHTGLLDAAGLWEAFAEPSPNIEAGLAAYAPGGEGRAAALYERSKEVSRPLAYRPDRDRRRDG